MEQYSTFRRVPRLGFFKTNKKKKKGLHSQHIIEAHGHTKYVATYVHVVGLHREMKEENKNEGETKVRRNNDRGIGAKENENAPTCHEDIRLSAP
jgi:hypothetical protein